MKRTVAIGAVGLFVFLVAACGEKPTIRLADTQFESLGVNNSIAKFLIENGYGYPVVIETMSSQTLEEWLPQGLVHIQMEGWEQNRADWYAQAVGSARIENFGPTYEEGPQFYMIPRWVHEQYRIDSVYDLESNWEVFRDPEDLTKGIFINCVLAWECAGINQVKLEAYGFADEYNMISPGDSLELAQAFTDAAESGEAIVGYYWAPNALMALHEWYVLQEPAYTDACWEIVLAGLVDRSLRPDKACAYNSVPINKIVWSGLSQMAPDVREMLGNMNVGLQPLNQTLAWMVQNGIDDNDEAAVYYLRTFQARWTAWMPEKEVEKVKKALNNVGD